MTYYEYLGDTRPLPMRDPGTEAKRFLDFGELIQRDAGHLGKTMEQYAQYKKDEGRMQDVTNLLDFNVQSNELINKYKKEVSKDPLNYEKHKKLAEETMGKIDSLNYSFYDDLSSKKFSVSKKMLMDDFNYKSSKEIWDGNLDKSRRSWRANLKILEDNNNFDGYIRMAQSGAGIFCTQEEADALSNEAGLKKSRFNLGDLMESDVPAAATALDNGDFDNLPPAELIRAKRFVENELGRRFGTEKLTAAQAAKARNGESSSLKITGPRGELPIKKQAREEMNNYGQLTEGTRNELWAQMEGDLDLVVDTESKKDFIKEYSAYGLLEEEVTAMAEMRLVENKAKTTNPNILDKQAFIDSATSQAHIILPSLYGKYERENDPVKKRALEEDVKRNLDELKQEFKRMYSIAYTGSLNHEGTPPTYEKQQEMAYKCFNESWGKVIGAKDNDKGFLERQDIVGIRLSEENFSTDSFKENEKNKESIFLNRIKELRMNAAEKRGAIESENRERFLPVVGKASRVPVTKVKEKDPGVYLSKKLFDALNEKRGAFAVRVWGLKNGKRSRYADNIPVLGWYEDPDDSSIQLTQGAYLEQMGLIDIGLVDFEIVRTKGEAPKYRKSPASFDNAWNTPGIEDLSPEDQGLLPDMDNLPEESTQVADSEFSLLPSKNS